MIETTSRMGVKTVVTLRRRRRSMAVDMADDDPRRPLTFEHKAIVQDKIMDAVRKYSAEAVTRFGFLSTPVCERLADGDRLHRPNPRAIEAIDNKIASKKFAAEAASTRPRPYGPDRVEGRGVRRLMAVRS